MPCRLKGCEIVGRKCKCQLTGEYGTTDTFYKAEDGKYYKTKELYEARKKEKEDRKAVIERFAVDFLDYKTGQVFPSVLTKKLKELEFYGYNVINRTIDKCYEAIQYSLRTKSFRSDINKIAYIFAIIKNNINDVYREFKKEKNEKTNDISTNDNYLDDVDIIDFQMRHKEKDIRRWLEVEDWL